MANEKFSELPVAVGLSGDEIIPIVQSGTNKRTTVGDIATFPVTDASFVVASSSSALSNERVLTQVSGQTVVTDNGANSTITIGLASLLTASSAGSATTSAAITWDAKGRLTAVTDTAIALNVIHGATYPTIAQGDVLYGSASNIVSALSKNASSTRYLSNTGTSNNPAWAQVSLATGVTGDLPVANLNSGSSASNTTFWRGDGTWASPSGSGTVNSGTSGQMAYYASTTNAVSGNANATISSGALTLGLATSVQGSLKLSGATSGTLTFAASATASGTITFPSGTTNFTATGGTSQVVKQTTSGGAFTVAQLAASDLSNSTTGSNEVVLKTSPTLVTPVLGVATATSINKVAITAPATSATLTIVDGKTLTLSKTMQFTAADDTGVYTFPTGTQTLITAAVTTLSSLVSIGTITTGGWHGTAIDVIYGGTGLTGLSQGDIIYASASNICSALAKSTSSTRYLANTGTSNNPAWAQVSLSTGVTGNLPVANLNSGSSATSSTFWRGDGTWASPATAPVAGDGISVSGSTVSINTNNTNGVGAYNYCATQSGTLASAATGSVAVSNLQITAGVPAWSNTNLSGTWRNVSGATIGTGADGANGPGMCIRTA